MTMDAICLVARNLNEKHEAATATGYCARCDALIAQLAPEREEERRRTCKRLYRDFMRVRRHNDRERRYIEAARLIARMEREIPGFAWVHPAIYDASIPCDCQECYEGRCYGRALGSRIED